MGLTMSFCGLQTCEFSGLKTSFWGSKDIILCVDDCHFAGLKMSFCGSRDVIFWV